MFNQERINGASFIKKMNFQTITPDELAEKLAAGENLRLVDVREEWEFDLARIKNTENLPLSRFAEWSSAISPDEKTVFICHHGIRSAQVCQVFARHGFENIINLTGGIDFWSTAVDRTVPRY